MHLVEHLQETNATEVNRDVTHKIQLQQNTVLGYAYLYKHLLNSLTQTVCRDRTGD